VLVEGGSAFGVQWNGLVGWGLTCVLSRRGHLRWGLLYPPPFLVVAVYAVFMVFVTLAGLVSVDDAVGAYRAR